MPDLMGDEDQEMDETSTDVPELESLGLPSDYDNAEQRELAGLQSFVSLELQIRTGKANDALKILRESIRLESTLISQKKIHACGTGPNTRAEAKIRQASCRKVEAAEEYITAYHALLNLGLNPMTDDTFAPINIETDLWMKDPTKTLQLRNGKHVEPWFWKKGLSKHSVDSDDRLLENFERLIRSFARMRQAWTSVAQEVEKASTLKAKAQMAYAYKMAN
ncbi:hypothetical protein M422DRAFT_275314 [Sphaerobolus stellatus SS14]|uniref:Uncharacterized protein n=1 Tax=Sphaerobolus stellatus (strain SS14) TaxID=990650 RepID=A0A0C9UFP4_SPHS4|nr:hypothetical protein M422DRAFT_275314 [Sphaerobolus stellatus SS14]